MNVKKTLIPLVAGVALSANVDAQEVSSNNLEVVSPQQPKTEIFQQKSSDIVDSTEAKVLSVLDFSLDDLLKDDVYIEKAREMILQDLTNRADSLKQLYKGERDSDIGFNFNLAVGNLDSFLNEFQRSYNDGDFESLDIARRNIKRLGEDFIALTQEDIGPVPQ